MQIDDLSFESRQCIHRDAVDTAIRDRGRRLFETDPEWNDRDAVDEEAEERVARLGHYPLAEDGPPARDLWRRSYLAAAHAIRDLERPEVLHFCTDIDRD